MSYQFSLKIRSGFQARLPPFSNARFRWILWLFRGEDGRAYRLDVIIKILCGGSELGEGSR